MFIYIGICFCLLSFCFQKSKLLNYLYFLFVCLLVCGNYNNGDYLAYERMYNAVFFEDISSFYEVGYKLLMIAGKLHGLTYQEFYSLIIMVPLFIVDRFIIKYSKLPFLCFVIFTIVYLPLDYVLLRNFISFSIILIGLEQILEKRKHAFYKYFCCVIIASTIHVSSLFYLILFWGRNKSRLKIKNILFYILLMFLFFILVTRSLSQEEVVDRTEEYSASILGFLILSFIQIVNLLIVNLFYRYKKTISGFYDEKDYLIININILLLFLVILYWSVGIFSRIFRHVSIINMIFFMNILSYYCNRLSHTRKLLLIIFIVYIIYFISFYTSTLEDTIFSLFLYNNIFEYQSI